VPKESRVLTGRSLQCLARHVAGAGIKLAIQLDIPDSVISGMAFDTMASGQTSADVTYRMLLLWKRRTAVVGGGDHQHCVSYVGVGERQSGTTPGSSAQVDTLVRAVAAATGNSRVADVIVDHHRANRELTPDCFIANERSPTNTPIVTNGLAAVFPATR